MGQKRPKHCSECGTKIGERDAYCGACGTAVPQKGVEAEQVRTAEVQASQARAMAPENAEPKPEPHTAQGFDSTAFGAALALGSVWALLNVRRGSLRWGWLCLVGAAPPPS